MVDAIRRVRSRPDALIAALVVLLFVGVEALPRSLPIGVRASALVFGSQSALAVIGVVLVQRSNRILSFAQVQLGAVGGSVFFGVVHEHSLLRLGRSIGIVEGNLSAAPRWMLNVEWFGAALVAIALSAVIGVLVHLLVIRRFAQSPPLVGTVATVAIAQGLSYAAGTGGALKLFGFGSKKVVGGTVPPPVDVTIHLSPATFHLPDIGSVVAVAACLGGVTWFLRRTRLGTAVRASAADPERARSLGVPTATVGSVVWAIAGAVSGLAAVLLIAAQGGGAAGGGVATLTRVLGAVVVAGAGALGLAVFVVLGFAMVDQATTYAYGSGTATDLVVLGLILVFLLVRPTGRAGRVEGALSWRAAREVRPIPRELAGLPAVRTLRRRVGVGVGIVVLALPFVAEPADTANATTALIYALVGLSLLLLTGWAGLISLGQFAFATVGGFTVALVGGRWGLPAPLALIAAGVVGATAAVAVGLPALRIRGLQLAVTSLAFALVTSNVLLSQRYGGQLLPKTLDRPNLFGLSTDGERAYYYLCLAVVGLVVLSLVGLRRSRTGRALVALRDNDRAAEAFGINLIRARLETFAIAGFIAALAGGLFAYQQGGVSVGDFPVELSITLFLMVIIGGLGSVSGPVLGAIVVGFLTPRLGGASSLITAVLVLLVLLFAEGGLAQVVFAGRDILLRRIAVRNRIAVPSLVADGRTAGDDRIPIRAKGGDEPVPVRYRLPRHELVLESVASDATGAQ